MQVLSGCRRQGAGTTSQGALRESSKGKARVFSKRKSPFGLGLFQSTDFSSQESKEAYFVALRRKGDVPKEEVFTDA